MRYDIEDYEELEQERIQFLRQEAYEREEKTEISGKTDLADQTKPC